jgi:UDP-N-acetyl-D-glucosamine/UDP-N-acetyl-D-galactosamine dehydrogenase
MKIFKNLIDKKTKLAVIGLGYVGLPLALALAKKISVIGFDSNAERIDTMKAGADPSHQLTSNDFVGTDIIFTSDSTALAHANFYIVAVPTTVDAHKIPNLTALQKAAETIGRVIKKGDYVVFESTVYPGCTEEDCLPIIERLSGLMAIKDFKTGYSPERINPGDTVHTLYNTVKIVAGCDAIAIEEIAKTYELVVTAGVHKAPSIKVAEAAKIIENTQRDLNISLMNELSIIFDKMHINTHDVLEAAATKWNFMPYYPGLVGGHCIGVDPYYLTYKAQQLGYHSKVIAAGRFVNDDMPRYVSKKVVQHIIKHNKNISTAKVLVLGATFKENVSDSRNSKVADMVKDLLEYSLQVDIVDAYADAAALMREYALPLVSTIGSGYDAIILAVGHNQYKNFTEEYLLSITNKHALFADLKGLYRNKITTLNYWSL